MKVFLSWSGGRSKEVATMLSEWLCCVIQAARPWISTRDLDRGSLWFGEINDQLKDTTVGIICLTQENRARPWILFEAGALAKGLSTSRVCTLLVDLEPKDVEDPLAQFNHTLPTRDGMYGLVRTLNSTLGSASLDLRILEQVFSTYWPQFQTRFAEVLKTTDAGAPTKPRTKEDVLGEILDNTRTMNSRIRRLESEVERWRSPAATTETKANIRKTLSAYELEAEEMQKLGMPSELILDRLIQRGLPKSIAYSVLQRLEGRSAESDA
jgi:hypothetical protein